MARSFVWTGFGPFLDYTYNPSWDVAQAAAEATDGAAHLLEVTFEAARAAADICDVTQAPTTLVHVGLAASRAHLSFERFAHNVLGGRDDRPDATPEEREELEAGGPLARQTSLLLGRLVDLYCDDEGDVPGGRISRDCGTFICNAIYYHSLGLHEDDGVDVLFVHVPMLTPDAARLVGRALARGMQRYYTL